MDIMSCHMGTILRIPDDDPYFKKFRAHSMVWEEMLKATAKYKPFNSAMEGYAVILEEVDELWDLIKAGKQGTRDKKKMLKEACQISAMALRYMLDICGDEI